MHEQSSRRTFTVRDSDGYRADFTEDEGGLSVSIADGVPVDIDPDDRSALAEFLRPTASPQPAATPAPERDERRERWVCEDTYGDKLTVRYDGPHQDYMVFVTHSGNGTSPAGPNVLVRRNDIMELLGFLAEKGFKL